MPRLAWTPLLILVAACGWTKQYPPYNPARWKSCGPNCRAPIGPPQPDCLVRGTAEFATWIAPRIGTQLVPSNLPAIGLALGGESTFPIALDDNFRVGPWLEVGGDTVAYVRARGGLTINLGGMPDPRFVPRFAGTHDEGAFGLRIGAGWYSSGALDDSNGAQLSARLTFGSRRYSETHNSYNSFDACDGSSYTVGYDGKRIGVGHWGPGFAYGHRVFVEIERSIDATRMQVIVGLEIDPVTAVFAAQQNRTDRWMAGLP